jgi:hypothetical protein
MRIADGVLLIVFTVALPCVCRSDSPSQQQHTSSSNLATFGRFFSQVAELRPATEAVYLNGQLSRLRYSTLQETINLSVREADLVTGVAVRCEEELKIERSARSARLSARLGSIAGQSESKEVTELLLKRNDIIATAAETLKAELGSTRFDVLASFVLEGSTRAKYFPLRAQ